MSDEAPADQFGETIARTYPGAVFLDRYEMKKIVGRGGMGVVWLAYDQRLDREVALKFLPDTLAADRGAVTELREETRKGIELNHSNIVRLYDFLTDEGAAAISMEYVDGNSLAERRFDKPDKVFEVEDLKEWVVQLCEALEYAHSRCKTIHRDIKPHNLMVNGGGELKITDFGISSTVHDSVSRLSRSDQDFSGTLAYMSPQQFLGRPSTPADDLYSLGATLYELLTGKPPFHRGNIQAQIERETPPSIAERRAEFKIQGDPIPKSWEQAIACCLEKEPEDRPKDAKEFLGMLAGKVRPASRKGSGVPNLIEVAKEKKGILIGVGGLAAAAVISAVMFTGGNPKVVEGPADNPTPAVVVEKGPLLAEAEAVELTVGKEAVALPPQVVTPKVGSEPQEPKESTAGIGSAMIGSASAAAEKTARELEAERERQLKALETAYQDSKVLASSAANPMEETKIWEAFLGEHGKIEIPDTADDTEIIGNARVHLGVAETNHAGEVAKIGEARKALEGELKRVSELEASSVEDLIAQEKEWEGLLTQIEAFEDPYSGSRDEIEEKAFVAAQEWAKKAGESVIRDRDVLFAGGRYSDYYGDNKRKILKDVQEKLKADGLYEKAVDGAPGPSTHAAIVAYQEKNGLLANGRLNDETLEKLNLDDYANPVPPKKSTSGGSNNRFKGEYRPAGPNLGDIVGPLLRKKLLGN